MSAKSAVFLPVLLRFPGLLAREDGWGRLLELAASAAVLASQSPVKAGDKILLCFEVHGEKFEDLRAVVEHAVFDEDGFCRAELRFNDEVHKRRLARVLLDVIARSIP
ncbi:MAG: hypothetical protein PHF00_03965 [Elusimicrobia bacterium]|nr:hypothetical protein [Elusimicrobiota bacterium]